MKKRIIKVLEYWKNVNQLIYYRKNYNGIRYGHIRNELDELLEYHLQADSMDELEFNTEILHQLFKCKKENKNGLIMDFEDEYTKDVYYIIMKGVPTKEINSYIAGN